MRQLIDHLTEKEIWNDRYDIINRNCQVFATLVLDFLRRKYNYHQ